MKKEKTKLNAEGEGKIDASSKMIKKKTKRSLACDSQEVNEVKKKRMKMEDCAVGDPVVVERIKKNVTESDTSDMTKRKIQTNKRNGSSTTEKPDDSKEERTVFVGNVPIDWNEKGLLKLLSQHGKVLKFWVRGAKLSAESKKMGKKMTMIKKKFHPNHPPLILYALFSTTKEAQQAIQLNGHLFNGHHLIVNSAKEKIQDQEKGVFVGNLHFSVTEDEIWTAFGSCGDIENVRIIRDKETGVGKGIGYVNFKSADAVELALMMDGETIRGRGLRVKRLQTKGEKKKLLNKKNKLAIKENSANTGVERKKKAFPSSSSSTNGEKKKKQFTGHKSNKNKKFHKKKVDKNVKRKKLLAEKLLSKKMTQHEK